MKRFLLVLLSMGLIAAFSGQAMAVDVKFSGEYYAAGMYLDKTDLRKDIGASTAFYFQRLRLKTDFVVSPGLSLTTRADIMERAWGASRTAPGIAQDTQSAGTRAENENIAFDLAYVTYLSPIGMFTVGYQIDEEWGLTFGNSATPKGLIAYAVRVGNLTLAARTGKDKEMSRTSNNPTGDTDKDQTFYTICGIYGWKNGEAGLLFRYIKNNQFRNAFSTPLTPDAGIAWDGYVVTPYLKAQLGRLSLEAQLYYLTGKQSWEGNTAALGSPQDVDLNQLTAYVGATFDLGKFYFGASLAYVSGDDFSTTDKQEGGVLGGGLDWKPCLIMFNSDLTYWEGKQSGHTGTSSGGPMSNAYFSQLRAGVRPIDKLDIMASASYAVADKTPQAVWDSRDYGYEIDLTATYKITNNLSYMLGAGYWMVGDYYKGSGAAGQDVDDNFMVINKLTLTF